MIENIIRSLIDTGCDISIKKENKKRTIYTVKVSEDRFEVAKRAKERLSKRDDLESISVNKQIIGKAFAFRLSERIYEIRLKPDRNYYYGLHELFTAALICQKFAPVYSSTDVISLLSHIININDSGRIIGKRTSIPFMNPDVYTILCQSISVANLIRSELIVQDPDKVFITEREWPEELSQFTANTSKMKSYNPSDIVVKMGNNYYGLSLKRKKRPNQPDPHMINKSFKALFDFSDVENKYILDEYDKVEEQFFSSVISSAIEDQIIPTQNVNIYWKDIINLIPNEYVNKKLKENKILYNFCNSVLIEREDIKTKMCTLAKKDDIHILTNFHFHTLIGIGEFVNNTMKVYAGKFKTTVNDLVIRYNGTYLFGPTCYM